MERILLLSEFIESEGELAVVLELVAGLFVVVASRINLDVEAADCLGGVAVRVGGATGEGECRGGEGSYGSNPEAGELFPGWVSP